VFEHVKASEGWSLISLASFGLPLSLFALLQLIGRLRRQALPAPNVPPVAWTPRLEQLRTRLRPLYGRLAPLVRSYLDIAFEDARYLLPFERFVDLNHADLQKQFERALWDHDFQEHAYGRKLVYALIERNGDAERRALDNGSLAFKSLVVTQLALGGAAFVLWSPNRSITAAIVAGAAAATAWLSSQWLTEARGGWSALLFGTFTWIFVAIFHFVFRSPDAGNVALDVWAALSWVGLAVGWLGAAMGAAY
jgi:hypothetical protein